MNKKNSLFKQLLHFVKLFQFNWKPWFLPATIDTRKDDIKTQRQKRIFNSFFGVFFGIVAVLMSLLAFPDIKGMVGLFFVVVLAYIAFCFILHSFTIKTNNSGRKTKAKIGSFPELFISHTDFDTVDSYVGSHYSNENTMTTSECHCLLDIIIKNNMVRDKSLDPMVTLFIKQYPYLLPQGITNRAITKAKIYNGQQSKMESQMFQNSSKK